MIKIDSNGVSSALKTNKANLKNEKPEAEFQDVLDKALASRDDKELKAASRQFEAMFIYQMFQQMRKTVDKGGLIKESMGETIFQDMLDYEVSVQSSSNSTLGLSDIIYKQLKLDQDK